MSKTKEAKAVKKFVDAFNKLAHTMPSYMAQDGPPAVAEKVTCLAVWAITCFARGYIEPLDRAVELPLSPEILALSKKHGIDIK